MLKFFKFLWALLPLILGCVVYFGYLRILPTFVKVILFVLFLIVWLCRKQIAETVISKLKHIPALDNFMWDDAGQKRDENGKLTQDRKPIESNIKLIKLGINLAIMLVFLGIPMLFVGIFALVGGFVDSMIASANIVMQDLGFANGVGFFIFALVELLIFLAFLVATVLSIVKNRKGDWDGRMTLLVIGGSFLIWRVVSWFYFEAGISGAIGEIILWAILALGTWFFIKFDIWGKIRAWRAGRRSGGTPPPIDHDGDDDFDDDFDDDYVDPI